MVFCVRDRWIFSRCLCRFGSWNKTVGSDVYFEMAKCTFKIYTHTVVLYTDSLRARRVHVIFFVIAVRNNWSAEWRNMSAWCSWKVSSHSLWPVITAFVSMRNRNRKMKTTNGERERVHNSKLYTHISIIKSWQNGLAYNCALSYTHRHTHAHCTHWMMI